MNTETSLLDQVLEKHCISAKELATELEVPRSALSGKKAAQYVQPMLEEWLEKEPEPLTDVDDVLEKALDDLQAELDKLEKRAIRGIELAEKAIARLPLRFKQYLFELSRLRRYKAVVAQMLEHTNHAEAHQETWNELVEKEEKLKAAIARTGPKAVLKAAIRRDTYVASLDTLAEERARMETDIETIQEQAELLNDEQELPDFLAILPEGVYHEHPEHMDFTAHETLELLPAPTFTPTANTSAPALAPAPKKVNPHASREGSGKSNKQKKQKASKRRASKKGRKNSRR